MTLPIVIELPGTNSARKLFEITWTFESVFLFRKTLYDQLITVSPPAYLNIKSINKSTTNHPHLGGGTLSINGFLLGSVLVFKTSDGCSFLDPTLKFDKFKRRRIGTTLRRVKKLNSEFAWFIRRFASYWNGLGQTPKVGKTGTVDKGACSLKTVRSTSDLLRHAHARQLDIPYI